MTRISRTRLIQRFLTTIVLTTTVLLATAVSAQRQVPVEIENDTSNPVPVAFAASGPLGGQTLQYVLCMDAITGPGVGSTYPGCMEIRSVGFEVTRPPPTTGGGSTPINIGLGTPEPIVIQKSIDAASADLWLFSINGNSNGDSQIYVLEERAGWGGPLPVLEIQLERTFMQSMKVEPTAYIENIMFRYIEMQVTSYTRDASGTVISQSQRCWNLTNNTSNCSF